MENIYKYAREETLKYYLEEIDNWTVEISANIKDQIKNALDNIGQKEDLNNT